MKMKGITKTLLKKAMVVLLTAAIMASMVFPLGAYAAGSNTSAVEDTTNTFVGTINGEEVIGYLDNTYVYYLSGKDYNASFVTLDENGAPKYKIYIRINEDVSVGSYSDSGKNDRDKVYLFVYTKFDKTKETFNDSYTFRDSKKSWTMELTNAEYSDDGVFEGTLEGTCMPYTYNHSPAYTEVTISGSFHFQMQTIHPTMETYRSEHSEYAAANEVSYVQSLGTSFGGSSSGASTSSASKGSSTVDHTCRTCKGTGSCQKCYGSGVIINSYNNKVRTCVRCQGSGKCAVCAGTGEVR